MFLEQVTRRGRPVGFFRICPAIVIHRFIGQMEALVLHPAPHRLVNVAMTGALAVAATVIISSQCEAQLTYDFVGEFVRQGPGTVTPGDVLATIEFSDLPARHDDVLSLTFTSAGDELYGLGLTFDDEFGFTSGPVTSDGANGLVGGGFTAVINSDESSLHDARALLVGGTGDEGSVNFIGLQLGTPLPFIVSGRFELVPEPRARLLGVTAFIFGLGFRHRRSYQRILAFKIDLTAKLLGLILCSCTFSVVWFMGNTAFAIDIPTIAVGNPGNSNDPVHRLDPRGTFGAVDDPFRMGTFEVTNAEYAEFLNAVAMTDSHALYSVEMSSDPRAGILRSGVDGDFSYDVKPNMGNKPVNYVSFWDAARFVNWLHNGQPAGAQDSTSTEQGAYALDGVTQPDTNIKRNAAARWFLPSEDEWYKAAYHHPREEGGERDNYWFYPMATPLDPVAATSNELGDIHGPMDKTANFQSSVNWNGLEGNVTTVGSAGDTSESFYGTSDQAGNVSEWTEGLFEDDFPFRIVRGGSWESRLFTDVSSAIWHATPPEVEHNTIGFRVATIAELLGDCNGDSLLNAADLSCVPSVEERDAVLGALNTLPGDLDGNGQVAFHDFLVLSANFGTDLPNYADGNIDLNDGVEFADFLLLSTNFGKTPSGLTAVPEPTNLVAAWLSSLGFVVSRRTRTRSYRH